MRLLVFILIFANLLSFAYFQGYFGKETSPDAQRLQKQINADRVQVLERDGERVADALPEAAQPVPSMPSVETAQIPTSPPSTPEPSSPPSTTQEPSSPPSATQMASADACALFSTPHSEMADALAEQATIAGLRIAHRSENNNGWWVIIPPQSNRQGAVRKIQELREMGVTEYFIIADGPLQFAVSLGVFSQESAASAYLEQLRGRGVRTARVEARRVGGAGRQLLEIRGDAIALMALRFNTPEGVTTQECR